MNKDYREVAIDIYDDMIASLEVMKEDIEMTVENASEYLNGYKEGRLSSVNDVITIVKDLRKELI